jgi:hypothetical protein
MSYRSIVVGFQLVILFQLVQVVQTASNSPEYQYRKAILNQYANDTSCGTWMVLIDRYYDDYQSVLGFQGVWSELDADTQPTPDGITVRFRLKIL